MSVELRPLGVKCNIQCQYCYQNPQRDAGNVLHAYDLDKMKSKISEEGGPFTLFGGEPLMVPEADLEELWAWGYEKFGRNGIQTNGVLINDAHIRLFKKYKVHVGMSLDGPGELNDVRWHGTLEKTRESTAKSHAAIERLCREGIPPSMIVTLHRNNATSDKLPVMHDWFRHLVSIGVSNLRLHLLEIDHESVRQKYSLTDEENVAALLSFAKLEGELSGLKFDLFSDMRNMLAGRDNNGTCIWTACDPYTTPAVRGVEGSGQSSNCGRTNKDGVDFTKAASEGYERYMALYQTPQEYDGCNGCRFFLMCKGQCPGTSISGDWRNRTEHCAVLMRLFRYFEEEMLNQGVVPISVSPKRPQLEKAFLDHWAAGKRIYMFQALKMVERSPAGNGSPAVVASARNSGGHGDAHGDHFDAAPRHGHVNAVENN